MTRQDYFNPFPARGTEEGASGVAEFPKSSAVSAPFREADSWIQLGKVRIRLTSSLDENGILLSPREREILMLIAQGDSIKAIARSLDISVHTVDTFRRRIYQKLGVSNAASATAVAIAFCLGAEVMVDR